MTSSFAEAKILFFSPFNCIIHGDLAICILCTCHRSKQKPRSTSSSFSCVSFRIHRANFIHGQLHQWDQILKSSSQFSLRQWRTPDIGSVLLLLDRSIQIREAELTVRLSFEYKRGTERKERKERVDMPFFALH